MNAAHLWTALATSVALYVGSAAYAQPSHESPPPPPPSYHPIEGPFLILLDDNGRIDPEYEGVIDTAWSAWRGPKLEAFIVCYLRSGDGRTNWTAVLRSVDNVAASMKARGAFAVVATPGYTCRDTSGAERRDGSYVKILGVLRG